jgi:hypothetical protein
MLCVFLITNPAQRPRITLTHKSLVRPSPKNTHLRPQTEKEAALSAIALGTRATR